MMGFKYFVIGSGSIGNRHAANLALLGAAVEQYSWRTIDLPRVLQKIADCNGNAGVIIATATNVRLPLIAQCAAAGAALYIEKPVAYRCDEVDQIFDLPDSILERSVAGFMMRYHPIVQYLLSHPVSNPFRASFEVGHDVRQWRKNWAFSDSYAADREGGGALLDLCHEIDLAWLLCEAPELSSVSSVNHPKFGGVDVASMLHFHFRTGCHAHVALDYLAPHLVRRGYILGLEEEVQFDFTKGTVLRTTQQESEVKSFTHDRNQMFLDLLVDFMSLAEGRKTTNQHVPRFKKA